MVKSRRLQEHLTKESVYTDKDGKDHNLSPLKEQTRVGGLFTALISDTIVRGSLENCINKQFDAATVMLDDMLNDTEIPGTTCDVIPQIPEVGPEMATRVRNAKVTNAFRCAARLEGQGTNAGKQTFGNPLDYFNSVPEAGKKIIGYLSEDAAGRNFLANARSLFDLLQRDNKQIMKAKAYQSINASDIRQTSQVTAIISSGSDDSCVVIGGGIPSAESPIICAKERKLCSPAAIICNIESDGKLYTQDGAELEELPECETILSINALTQTGTLTVQEYCEKTKATLAITIVPIEVSPLYEGQDDLSKIQYYHKKLDDPKACIKLSNDILVIHVPPIGIHSIRCVSNLEDINLQKALGIEPGHKLSKNETYVVKPKYDGVAHYLSIDKGKLQIAPRTVDLVPATRDATRSTVCLAGTCDVTKLRLQCLIEVVEVGGHLRYHVLRVFEINGRRCLPSIHITCVVADALPDIGPLSRCSQDPCDCPTDGTILESITNPKEVYLKNKVIIDVLEESGTVRVGEIRIRGNFFSEYELKGNVNHPTCGKRRFCPAWTVKNFADITNPQLLIMSDDIIPNASAKFRPRAELLDVDIEIDLNRPTTFDQKGCHDCGQLRCIATCIQHELRCCIYHPCTSCNEKDFIYIGIQTRDDQQCSLEDCTAPAWATCKIHDFNICIGCCSDYGESFITEPCTGMCEFIGLSAD